MIKVSVLYPNEEGKRFDVEYYCNKHIPMVQKMLGAALKSSAVERGLGGVQPGSRPTYIVMAHMCFDSIGAFQAAFGPHVGAIEADVPNYTDMQPTVQISEVIV
jgi:uncharacterized protein (TIGR02118 family)